MVGLLVLLALICIVVGVVLIVTKRTVVIGVVLIILGVIIFLLRHNLDQGAQNDPAAFVAALMLATR